MNQDHRSDLWGAISVALSCEAFVVLVIFAGAVVGSQAGSITAAIGNWVGQ